MEFFQIIEFPCPMVRKHWFRWYAKVDTIKTLESVQKRPLKKVCLDHHSTCEEFWSKLLFSPLSSYMQLQELLASSECIKCTAGYYVYDFFLYNCLNNFLRESRFYSDV